MGRWTAALSFLSGAVEPVAARLRPHTEVLARRWRTVAGGAAGAVVLASLACVVVPSRYTATARLHVEPLTPKAVQTSQGVEVSEEVGLLGSRILVAEVIRQLGLDRDPDFVNARRRVGWLGPATRALKRLRTATRPARDSQEDADADERLLLDVPGALIGKYRSWLEVAATADVRTIEVSFTSPSPALARQVASAHAAQYVRRRLGLRSQLTGEPATFLEEEIDRVRGELLAAEGALAELRGEHPTIALDGRQQTLATRLTELGRRLGEAEADRIAAESEHRLARSRSYDGLPAVASNPRIQALRAEANRLETRHAELRKSFLAASPEFHDISAQLRGMRARLEREMARATGAIDSRLIVARGTEASLRTDLARTETSLRALDELTRDAIELDQGAAHGRALYEALRARKQEADLLRGMELSSALLLDPAPLPARPSEPRVLYDLGLSLLAGLGLGALAALRVEALHARLETPDDVRRGLGLPPLGVVPDFTLVPGADGPSDPSIAAEAYRGVRTGLGFLDPERPPRSVVVTSSEPGEGKTATAVNLAISLAALDCRVILVDAALRGAAVHRALGLPPAPGLTDVVSGRASLAAAIRGIDPTTGGPTAAAAAGALHVLAAGTPAGDPADVLGSPRWHDLLRSLAKRYDTVVIDGPAVLAAADAALLAAAAEAAVLVVRGHRTERPVVRRALARLRAVHARVIGVVLNGVDPACGYYRSYAYPFAA